MKTESLPHFTIKKKSQKSSVDFSVVLAEPILKDICKQVTGSDDYSVEFDDKGYNIGRLAILEYDNSKAYISFSDPEAKGRNSSFQSVPSALSRYILDKSKNKRMFFYLLPSEGNVETNYFLFMYRLMKSAGIDFLNDQDVLNQQVQPFTTVEDIIAARNINRGQNKSNNSTFVTKSTEYTPQIYGKMYGANKYETTLLGVALSNLSTQVEIYQILEGNLKVLPETSRIALNSLGNVKLFATDLKMEKNQFEQPDNLRSPLYIYNLLDKLGPKKCALCDCEIPELVQGAHIWPVSAIKKVESETLDRKLEWATDGDNGLWLCENHHKLLDTNLIGISEFGEIQFLANMKQNDKRYIEITTTNKSLPDDVLTPGFIGYLRKRYELSAGIG
ncbi:MAG: hypothetical protein B2I17_03380 [Thermoplasmatales archaeon B_DKE]|nr:MAG: hypothetical protein B2I17_03380 [Thermoplasmatales archaeon B_DKE]